MSEGSGLALFVFVALCPKSTAMVIAGRSVHLTTLFSWAGLNKRLTSNSCTYFRLSFSAKVHVNIFLSVCWQPYLSIRAKLSNPFIHRSSHIIFFKQIFVLWAKSEHINEYGGAVFFKFFKANLISKDFSRQLSKFKYFLSLCEPCGGLRHVAKVEKSVGKTLSYQIGDIHYSILR